MIRRFRSIIAGILGIVVLLGAIGSTVGIWANRTVFDSDHFAATIDRTLTDPAVTQALAEYTTRQVFLAIPVERGTRRLLPGRTETLAPQLTDRLQDEFETRLKARLEQPATRAQIVTAVRASHASLLDAVDRGGVANLQVRDGAITVNLLPLVVDGIRVLPDNMLTRRLELPQLAYGGDHTQQVAQLSDALGVELPADLGLVEVYRSDTVDKADTMLTTLRSSIVLFHHTLGALVAVTGLGLIAMFVIATNRRRALLWLAVGGAVGFGATLLTFRHSIDVAAGMAVDPANQTVIRAVLEALTHTLMITSSAAIVVCALIAASMAILGLLPGLRRR